MPVAPFQFRTASAIHFGRGKAAELPQLVQALGRRALVVTGSNKARHQSIFEALEAAGVACTTYAVPGEPSVEVALNGVKLARANADVVVSIGGGSAIDAGKAIAALSTNAGDPLDYLEVVGKGKPLSQAPLPFVAVPTTSGTGAEVTKNAVLTESRSRTKVSLRSDMMLPRVALVDPVLTQSVPANVTAATGLDALTQVIEPYLSCQANPLTDALCLSGIASARDGLLRAFENGDDIDAREMLSLTSLFGGLALANAKLGAVHGIAGPFGGMFEAAHGAVCARLLPSILGTNLAVLRLRAPGSHVLLRFEELGRLLCNDRQARAEDGIAWLERLIERLQIPRLASYGFESRHFDELVKKAHRSSSMKGNPVELTPNELVQAIERCR